MGYTTDFFGRFELNKKLDVKTYTFLEKLNNTRRMKRNLDANYGVEGEFYVEDDDEGVINHNQSPSTQPGLWCHWVPTEDRKHIEWDGSEKFYSYVKWLEYIIKSVLQSQGYVLNGEVEFKGEDENDSGFVICKDNKVTKVIKEIRQII